MKAVSVFMKRQKPCWIWIILVVAAISRLIALGWKSLYVDEAVTVYISQRPISTIVPLMMQLHEVHPPLYFWFINIWIGLWKHLGFLKLDYLFYVRLSSVIFGTLSVSFTYLLGRKLFDTRIALLSSFFLAISSFHVYFSQELRMYPIILFLMLGSFYFLISLIEKPGIKPALGFVLTTGPALVTHYYSFYIIAIEILFLLYLVIFRKRIMSYNLPHQPSKKDDVVKEEKCFDYVIAGILKDPSSIKNRIFWILGSFIASFLFFVAWIPNFLNQTGSQDFTLRTSPTLPQFFEIFSRLAYGFTLEHLKIGNIDLFILASALPIVLIVAALVDTIGIGNSASKTPTPELAGRMPSLHKTGLVFMGIYMLTPVILTFLVTFFTRFNIFEFKYFYIITPAFWMLISYTSLRMKSDWVRYIVITFFVVFNLCTWSNAQFNSYYYPQEWKKSASVVKSSVKPGDLVAVHPSMMSIPFHFYYGNTDNFLPMDFPDDQRMKKLSDYNGLWLVTTPYHPFVRKAGLTDYLKDKYPWERVDEIQNFRHSGVIWVEYYRLREDG